MTISTNQAVLPVITYDDAGPDVRATFDKLKKQVGRVPNLYASYANSTHALNGNLAFDAELGKGVFTNVEREIIKLASSQSNNCAYCIAAHTAILKMNKLDDAETLKIRRGTASNEKHAALAKLAYEITETRGHPDIESLDAFFSVGYTRAALAELIGVVAINIMNNYTHHIGQADIDFPEPPALD